MGARFLSLGSQGEMFIIMEMTKQQTFQNMLDLYGYYRPALKNYTFIVATTERDNMDLCADLKGYQGIEKNLFIPFNNGRVSIINDRIFKRIYRKSDSRARILKGVSFDTQTISYVEALYNKGKVPYENFNNVVNLINGTEYGIDYIPYVLENLLFDTSRKYSVERNIFAFEMMCKENYKNEKLCEQRARRVVALYENKKQFITEVARDLYKMIYLSLLVICIVQLRFKKLPLEEKMFFLVNFMSSELCRIMHPELILAKHYFSKSNSCAFFGKIHVDNKEIIATIKNMAWDIMHLRFISYGSAYHANKNADAIIPYFFTYDKRLNEIAQCYALQELVINDKKHTAIPFYASISEIVKYVEKYSTYEMHLERAAKNPNIDALIGDYERDIQMLVN